MVTKKQTANDDKTEKRYYNERKKYRNGQKNRRISGGMAERAEYITGFLERKKIPKTVQKKGKKQSTDPN
ncbi:MAG: hypothetical protein MSA51_08145 [Fusicatenibacter saccharivorans]|nr:hypothetical protein [Fusicatenibacter saccharivorans]